MDVMIREFGRYVADRHRTELFRRAIAEQVRHGDVVVDLGTGFGLLALLAVRQGARHVYAIEQAQYIDLARGIAADNGVADLITFLHGNSGGIELPERADCLIAELLGQYALEEYLVEYVHDAAQRFLKPGARVAPSAVTLRLAPVDMPGVRERLAGRLSEPWTGVAGFDFRRLQRAVAANDLSPYLVELFGDGDRLLAPAASIAHFRLPEDRDSKFHTAIEFAFERDGVLDGFLGTFDAVLSPSVLLSTGVDQPETHWKQVLFPVFPARPVRAGDRIGVEIGFLAGGRWSYRLAPANRSVA
jgi:hypothetical protein